MGVLSFLGRENIVKRDLNNVSVVIFYFLICFICFLEQCK
ncbi:hypothetical protein ETAE_0339 [Edwardsiella piscicida]|uniref:Uncharacterized protein n=1 Tax=Edwardsiella piscicida TaxID=1263550 RepID=A0AAU8P127_EDWPI|nr:hypothetical protein ETAE_0339 [Edwardsiella tarda EIB202]